MSVNKVILVGRLGTDPEKLVTGSGRSVAKFNLATSETWKDKSGQKQEKTEWHRIVVWGAQAENCAQYLSKGRQVYIEGKLQTRQWDDKEGKKRYTTEVVAQSVQFLGSKGDSSGRSVEFTSPPANSDEAPAFDIDAGPDDIPF
ncbi:MAG TPA: single-stranded DNA-binding protein [bacterium]|nr:single-stranded DNA-binding protein [Myxococcales bacterium]OQA62414.1 MAG: Single-stranded DNA-binding protein [bacterium ADurb.Bin270]HPW46005.1 single-stranded DNA-binding protein [bacterium]HQC51182.1 single-stranded DNA-binding protein [bacterium]HQG13375.1 single-stranded DNA-binding protein [bacterium]